MCRNAQEEKLRRAAIEWAYIQLGSSPEVLLARSKGERGTVLNIRDCLRWPPEKQKHSRLIWRTLRAIQAGQGDRGRGGGYEGQAREFKLTRGEQLVAVSCLCKGHGQRLAWPRAAAHAPHAPLRMCHTRR